MCMLCQARDPSVYHYDSHGLDNFEGNNDVSASGTKPVYTYDQIADYLTEGFWSDFTGGGKRAFDVSPGDTITVNLNGLTASAQDTAWQALESWTAVSGLQFEHASNAMITFDDTQSGAFARSWTSGETITRSEINVAQSWSNYGKYYLQTFIHEIGHALGLGHTGDYNGSARYSRDADFANDSWQVSIMSYFSQYENTATDASFNYLATAQMADIVAIHRLYGTPNNVETGNTVYGDNETTGRHGMDLPSGWAVAIVDSGGTDKIDLGSRSANQMLSLEAESYSNIDGKNASFSIARGTIIENARTGSGDDVIFGNAADNELDGGAGDDELYGKAGDDILIGGDGADYLMGGEDADTYAYNGLSESGDDIADFDLAEGDRIDLTGLLTDIGYTGSDAVADGVVYLTGNGNGASLMVQSNGGATEVAFLDGVSGDADLAAMLNLADQPSDPDPDPDPDPNPGPDPDPDPDPDPNPNGIDTTYVFTNDFVSNWHEGIAIVRDTDGGNDTLDLTAVTYGSRIYLEDGVRGKIGTKSLTVAENTEIENLLLGIGADRGYGNALDNVIEGNGGSDRFYGLDGDDSLDGGDGADRVYGDGGDDIVDGGAGADRLYGGIGDDTMTGGSESDRLEGGEGNDSLSGDDGNDGIKAGAGDDTLDGGAGNDKLDGGDGDDVISGGVGFDKIGGDAGDDSIDAGDGDDRIDGDDGNDSIEAGQGNDRVGGDAGDDVIDGGDGDDRIMGDDGDDEIIGGAGVDMVKGGDGADTIDSGDGDDRLFGDNDDDVMWAGAGNDRGSGGAGDDVIWAGEGDDRIAGGSGNDEIWAGAGVDNIQGGTNDDAIYGQGGNDKLRGDSGDDTIFGGSGIDDIDGGSDDDVITGGAGADKIKGGGNADVFVYNSVSEIGDNILDFSLRSGDAFDISGLLTEMGTTLTDVLDAGQVGLGAERKAWLQVDLDGAGGQDAVLIAELNGIRSTEEVTSDWFV